MGILDRILSLFKTDKCNSVEDLAKKCDGNITKLNDWINFNIWYKDDPKNIWQSAEETLKKQSGDCEDFAILKHEVLKIWGINSYIVSGYDKTSIGHAVCVAILDDKVLVLDYDITPVEVKNGKFEMTDIAKIIKPNMIYYHVYDCPEIQSKISEGEIIHVRKHRK